MRRVLIGTLTYDGKLPIEWFNSYLRSQSYLLEKNIAISPVMIKGEHFIDRGRNDILHLARENEFDDLVYIDSDIIWEEEDLYKLLSHSVDCVSATYRRKSIEETYPLKFRKNGEGSERLSYSDSLKLWKVFGVPAGFLRLSAKAIDRLWDKCDRYVEERGDSRSGERAMAFSTSICSKTQTYISEDIGFCFNWMEKCNQDLWLDSTIKLIHQGELNYSGDPSDWINQVIDKYELN